MQIAVEVQLGPVHMMYIHRHPAGGNAGGPDPAYAAPARRHGGTTS
jgi:hypothetical protein